MQVVSSVQVEKSSQLGTEMPCWVQILVWGSSAVQFTFDEDRYDYGSFRSIHRFTLDLMQGIHQIGTLLKYGMS